ncbi:uncharacterized protein LOC132042906 [Lycium ferocissimum]|uniref:uncharacterized protein LOC132042906 n=1 Tax=Lycium ferocissimum TaxID=112874 RepID=UPI002815E012|nr:uncharacterized protein LOC132042906 [Lycium ferocissimum]
MDEDRDRGWLERFVRVRTSDIIPEEYMPFPEKWNDNRLPKGSVQPRPGTAAEQAAPTPAFDSAGSSRIIAAAQKRRKPSDKGDKPRKRARRVVRSLRDEEESDVIIRRVGVAPTFESVPEEEIAVPPPSTEEAPSASTQLPGGEEILYATPLRSIEFIDITGEASSEEIPLQRPRRSGPESTAETGTRTEAAPGTEGPAETGSLPTEDPTIGLEASTSTEAAGAVPTTPTAPRSDSLDEMFLDTPPATGEAAGFGHLPIPRVTRAANRSTETGARESLVSLFPAPSVEPRRTRSAVITVPEDCSFLSRPSVVLVNEAFIRAQQEVDDLKGQLDAQGRETEKFQHLLQVKEEELSRAMALTNLRPELDATKAENLRLKGELAGFVDRNRLLEEEKIGLSQDNARLSSRLSELETSISQLRGELDSVKSDAVNMAERHRRLESESANYAERMRVFEQKAEDRARMCDELRTKLGEMTEANDILKAELDSANQYRSVLDVERNELLVKLARAEANLAEALKSVEAVEAYSTVAVEHERWRSRRITLEEAERGFTDLPALIREARRTEEEAKRALDSDSDDSERTESEHSGSSHTG